MKKMILILLCLLLLCGCRGKQETSERNKDPAETSAGSRADIVTEEMGKEAASPAEAASSLDAGNADKAESAAEVYTDIPEEWISYEETPETPTRPMEVVEEQSAEELTVPEPSETLPEYQSQPNENETPLAIG